MGDTENLTGKVVEEFPAPPAYYTLFTMEKVMEPPFVPATNPYLQAYNGGFAYIHENVPKAQAGRDYKQSLKDGLQDIVNFSLELVSNRNPAEGETIVAVEQKALNLRDKLVSLHDVLHEYREVEAREKLIATMVKQLEEAERVEATLARALEDSEKLLQGQGLL